jgi:hypothetical protein
MALPNVLNMPLFLKLSVAGQVYLTSGYKIKKTGTHEPRFFKDYWTNYMTIRKGRLSSAF